MAIESPTTPAPALKSARSMSDCFSTPAAQPAFVELLDSLTQLLRIEELFASDLSFDPAFDLDPAESVHAFENVRACLQRVLRRHPVSRSDKALTLAALMVRLAIDMEEPMDREGVHQMIGQARSCLMLAGRDPDAAFTNQLLRVAFNRLDALAALEHGDDRHPSGDDHEVDDEALICAFA